MSNVFASRPASHASGTAKMTLPYIKHPLSRVSNPEDIDVRGVSRSGERPLSQLDTGRRSVDVLQIAQRKSLTSSQGRPLGHEDPTMQSSRRIPSRMSTSRKNGHLVPLVHESIPEGVEVTQGDPNKAHLPIFGNRADVTSRMDGMSRQESRVSGRMSRSSTQARLEIDEIEAAIKEKMRSHFNEVKKRFKDNDPEQKGNVSREGLSQVICTLIGRPVSHSHIIRLLHRIGFSDKNVIHYSEFFAAFRDSSDKEYPKWMDPIQRYQTDKVTMSANQVHQHLKQQARQRFLDLADIIPQLNPDGAEHIERAELGNVLKKMNFQMDPDEFDKLWSKYDPDNRGTINGEKLLNILGINLTKTADGRHREQLTTRSDKSERSPRAKEIERKRSLDIERWIKSKFREGFQVMRSAFEKTDPNKTGNVRQEDFLVVLEQHGLSLEPHLLPAFLARCGITKQDTKVPYRDFLHRFQDRGPDGIPNEILSNPTHRFNDSDRPMTEGNKFTDIEVQLMNMFQRDFLALLAFFKRIDQFNLGIVTQEEFRAAIESRFALDLTDAQFSGLLDSLPLNEEGSVRYQEFMQKFDSKGQAPSLFDKRANEPSPTVDMLIVEKPEHGRKARRSHRELFVIIKELLTREYQKVEETFYEMDDINSRRLNQETMYQLLKNFYIEPEVTREEICDLWKTFITHTDKTLDFLEFVRHFGYSLRSAAYPNAKIAPPRRGDADFMMRSRKLNCAADMLHDNLRSMIDYMWEELRNEFNAMDPHKTGHVTAFEFKEVMTELCPNLSDFELDLITKKFTRKTDGSISYVELLRPYATGRQGWRHGNNMLALLQHPQATLPGNGVPPHPQKGLSAITTALREKLSGDWRSLRRAFRKLDTMNEGFLTMQEFRSVLQLANVVLGEDDVYDIMNLYDGNMTGKVPYEKFISDAFRPKSQQSVYKIC